MVIIKDKKIIRWINFWYLFNENLVNFFRKNHIEDQNYSNEINMNCILQKNNNQPSIPMYHECNFNNFLIQDTSTFLPNNFPANESLRNLSQNILNNNLSMDNIGNLLVNDNFAQNLLFNIENTVYNNDFPVKPSIINTTNGNYYNAYNINPCYNNGFQNQVIGAFQSNQIPGASGANPNDFTSYIKTTASNNANNIIINDNISNLNNQMNEETLLKRIRPRSIKNNKIVFCHSSKKKKEKSNKNGTPILDFSKDINSSIYVSLLHKI